MSYWYDYIIETERRRDELAQAAARHRINHILREIEVANAIFAGGAADGAPQRAPRRYELMLAALGAALGNFLIAWGYRLQTRQRHLR